MSYVQASFELSLNVCSKTEVHQMMLHNNIIVTTLSISCVLSLSNSWELFLLDGKGTSHNSTRIKRQIQVCALPDHPPNGKYIFIGSQGAYTPNTFVNELSIIRLTCTEPYVTRSENPQSLCFEGLWSPPLLDVEECVEPITTITGTTTTTTTTRTTTSLVTTATATGTQLSSSENLCVLPSHPRNGEFSIDISTGPYQYIPGANAPALAILRLSCFNSYVPEKPKPQSLCTDGVWSPLITTLGTCIHSALPNPTLDTSCLLPPHPSNGEFRILGPELYMPNTSVAEHSSIDLKCRPSYTTENKLVRALCFQGEWVPPFSGLETCSRKDALTTTTQAPTEPHTCILPDHPTNGRFKIKGTENYDYKPNSVVQQYTNIELICSEDGAESKPADAVCFDGKWLNLGTCTRNRTPTATESSPPRDGCIIPSNQTHGTYKLGNDESFDTIIFTCKKGYYPLYLSHWCDNGDWNPPLFDCIRTCPPLLKSETYTATCKRNRNYVDCSKGLEGTQVIDVKCNTFFEYKTIRPIPKCKDGAWTHDIVPCVPECGKRQVPVQELIIEGKYSEKGEYPWLVGIYHNQSHICGGSIISRFYVLSAAHCFTVYNNTLEALNPIDENEYLVAAGKHYRTLYDAKDTYRQIIGVKRIYISRFYLGIIQNYREDYAILQVKEPFILSQYVQLVCVDWESNYIEDDFIENKTALVIFVNDLFRLRVGHVRVIFLLVSLKNMDVRKLGWGYTLEGSSPSEELKKLKVHFKSRPSCNKNFRQDFAQRYFIDDKVCAGYIGQSVCKGDSGGGLYFEHENVYYVRGIVSVSPVSKTGCSVKYYALYTDVSKYIETITQETGRLL